MPDTDTRSLQQIKRETEQTRAGLTNTVEQLKTSVADTASEIRQRISPDAIKAEVSDYIKSRGEQLVNDVTSAARKNPMQAVAVGATLAYPLFRLARAIPAPVLMVGAGLFLAGSKTGQTVTQKASDIASDLSEDLLQRAHDLGDQVEEFGDFSEELCIRPVRSHQCRRIGRSRPDQPDCRRCKWRLRCRFQNGSGPGGLTRRHGGWSRHRPQGGGRPNGDFCRGRRPGYRCIARRFGGKPGE